MSVGIDEVPTSVIKLSSGVICVPIASLFNDFLLNGSYPDLMKIGKIIPIYKSADKRIHELSTDIYPHKLFKRFLRN